MQKQEIKKALAAGNTDITVIFKDKSLERLTKLLNNEIAQQLMAEDEIQALIIICEMIETKEIHSLNLKMQFVYG